MFWLALAWLPLTAAAQTGTAPDAAAAASIRHPLVGIWRLELPMLGCHEVYRFRSNGTTLVTSAREVAEGRYQIEPIDAAEGRHRLTDELLSTNGQRDCSGVVATPGRSVVHELRFAPGRSDRFVLCAPGNPQACIGPFVRLAETDT